MSSRRGGTLIEVLVVTGLLATLSVMLYQIYVTALNSETRSSASGGAYRQAFATLEQIRRELRGARLLAPVPGQSLPAARFQAPFQTPTGVVAVDAAGLPTWQPMAEVARQSSGTVMCRDRVLGHLGSQGSLVFKRSTGVLLDITVRAHAADGRSEGSHDIAYRMLLPNQE